MCICCNYEVNELYIQLVKCSRLTRSYLKFKYKTLCTLLTVKMNAINGFVKINFYAVSNCCVTLEIANTLFYCVIYICSVL